MKRKIPFPWDRVPPLKGNDEQLLQEFTGDKLKSQIITLEKQLAEERSKVVELTKQIAETRKELASTKKSLYDLLHKNSRNLKDAYDYLDYEDERLR